MKRIMIVGSYGTGKSTFASHLQRVLKIELIHLDKLFWEPNWTPVSHEKQAEILEQEIKKENWIMDGFYPWTFDVRLKRADTIIFLDIPRLLCMWNITIRRIRLKLTGIKRKDIAEGCFDKFNFSFYYRIWTFKNKVRNKFINKLKSIENEKKVYILRGYKEYNNFLNQLK